MAIAVHHSEKCLEWPHRFKVLPGHHPRQLMQVVQVMSGPGCEQLRQCHRPKNRVESPAIEVPGDKRKSAKLGKAFPARFRERVQQPIKRLALAFPHMSPAIKRRKRRRFAVLQNPFGTRNPVGALAMDEVADDIERAPRFVAFVARRPFVRKAAEQGVNGGGCAGEQSNAVVEIVRHSLQMLREEPQIHSKSPIRGSHTGGPVRICTVRFNCPHAAKISRPRGFLIYAGIPWNLSRS